MSPGWPGDDAERLSAGCIRAHVRAGGTAMRRFVSGLLTAEAVTPAHTELMNGQTVKFTLGQAKNLGPASARAGLAGQVLGLIPNDLGVTIITPADAPQVYNAIDLLKSIWLWMGLL